MILIFFCSFGKKRANYLFAALTIIPVPFILIKQCYNIEYIIILIIGLYLKKYISAL